jgi:hypothetical protein
MQRRQQGLERDSDCARQEDDERLLQLLDLHQQRHSDDRYQDGRNIVQSTAPKHETSPGDGARGRGADAVDEGFDAEIFGEAPEVRGREHGEEVARPESRQASDASANRTCDQVADEGDRNDYRPWRDHGDGDRIEKLLVIQPMESVDDAAM